MIRLIDDLDKYSDLILSVKTHEKERPLEPIEVSKYIMRMIKELPNETLLQISKRLHLNDATQTKDFLKLLELPEKVHYLLGWKVHQDEKIPFTLAVELSGLENKDDIEYLIKAGLEHKFTKNEAIRIVQLKKKFLEKPIDVCIEEVLKVRPVIEKGYLIINVLKEKTLAKIETISKEKRISTNDLILELVNERLEAGKTGSAKIKGKVVQLSLDESGYRSILKYQDKKKIRFNDVVQNLLEEKFRND